MEKKSLSNASHAKEIEEILSDLDTKEYGLSQDEARARLQKFGLNELEKEKGKSPVKLFLEQFKNILVVILLVATGFFLPIWGGLHGIVVI